MKSPPFKLSVGLVGFLTHETRENIERVYSAPQANVGFPETSQKPDSEPDIKSAIPDDPAGNRATWTRAVTPDSRAPLIPPEVRAKIEAIEAEARANGWPAELLWNAGFWDCPRGLAALLDAEDEIFEVTPDYIEILKIRRHLLKFHRQAA